MPIPVRTERPAEVGADRLVNSLAVGRLYGAPAIVVDFGTATTFDCVARDGGYVGGAITPGLEIGLEALASRTARLPHIELVEPSKAIGTDTVSAMQSGIVLGYRALTLGLLERIRAELARAEKGRRAGRPGRADWRPLRCALGAQPARRGRSGPGADPQGSGYSLGPWSAARLRSRARR